MAPDGQFFVVSAQVIPLLMLAGLIEYRGTPAPARPAGPRHRLDREERSLLVIRLVAMALVVVGEVAALSAVASGPSAIRTQAVRAGLAAAGFLVVDRFLDGELDRLNATMRRPLRLVVILVFALVVLGAIAMPVLAPLVP